MLIRQTLAYLPAQLFGPLLQFAAVITLTHFLSPADYGMTMLLFTSQELIFLVCLLWWTTYLQRYGGRFEPAEDRRRFRATENVILLVSILPQIALILTLLTTVIGEQNKLVWLASSAFVVTRNFIGYLSERARFEVRIKDFTILQVSPPLLGLAFSVPALEWAMAGPGLVLLAFALGQLLVGLVVGLRMRMFEPLLAVDRGILRAALALGVTMILAGALQWGASNGVRFVVQLLGGAVPLGLLSVPWGIAQRLAGMAGMLVTAAAYPLAVRAMHAGDVEGARQQISVNSALLLLVLAPAVAGIIAINEPMMRLLIAPEFQAASIAVLPAAILAAGVRNMRVHGWDQLYLLFEAQPAMLALGGIELLLLTVGSVVGMWVAGIEGAVLANAAVTTLAACVDYLYLRARFGLRAPFGQYARIILAALVMLAALLGERLHGWRVLPSWGSILLAVAVGGLIYGGMLVLLFPAARAQVIGTIMAGLARRERPPASPG